MRAPGSQASAGTASRDEASSRIRLRRALLLQFAGLLGAGALFAGWLVWRADRDFRDDLIQQVQRVADAVDPLIFAALTGTAEDLNNPRYLRLKEQLVQVRTLYPRCRFLYLLGRRSDGSVFIYLDSEPTDSQDYSPPGEVFEQATPKFRAVFDTHVAVAEGPITDEWGWWISGLTPLTDARTGKVVAMLAMDVDGRIWRRELVRAAVPAAVFTLLLGASVLVATALRAGRPYRDGIPTGWRRHVELALAGAVGLTLTLSGAWVAYSVETHQRDETFERLATSQAAAVMERLKNIRNSQLESLALYYMSNEEVSRDEFQLFARSLTSNPVVAVWAWMPAVEEKDREAFEAKMREETGEPFRIWELDAEGREVPAGSRPVYYPVAMAASTGTERLTMGFDAASEARRRAALQFASETGLMTAADPVAVLSRLDTRKGIIIYRPVFAIGEFRQLRGFVGAAVRMADLLKEEMAESDPQLEISLLHGNVTRELLASNSPAVSKRDLRSTPRPFFAFGKVFFVTVSEAMTLAQESPRQAAGLAVLAGLALTGTGMTIVGLTLRQRTRLERRVAEQTRDLQARTAFFEALVDSSVDGILVVDSSGKKVLQNKRMDEVWQIPPEISADADDRRQVRFVTGRTKNPDEFVAKVAHLYSHPEEVSRDIVELIDDSVLDRYTAPVRDVHGQHYGRIWSFRDITERRRTEQALRDSEARYRSIIVVSNTGAWEYHQKSDFLWGSAEYFGMLGRSGADFDLSGKANLKEAWVSLLHPDDREQAVEHFAKYIRDGSAGTYENYFRMMHRSGDWVWIWSRGQTLRDAEGRITELTVGTHIDITERKRAAMALEDAHRTLQERIKEVNCLYGILKLMERSNATLGELLGAAVEMIPQAWQFPNAACARIICDGQEYVSAGFRNTRWGLATPILVAGKTVGQVEVCYREEGHEWFEDPFLREERALVGNLATQLSFMIERKRTEEKLDQLSSIIEQAPLSVVITDLAGVVEYVNPKFCAVSGYAPGEVIGLPTAMLWAEDMPADARRELNQAIAANQVWTGEVRSRRKNGDSYLENVVAAPLTGDDGRIKHYVALKDDITAQKRFEAEATAMLQQERKISEMKSQFISVTSHEFRTPLAAAVGSLELLDRHADQMTAAKRAELLARAQRSLGRLNEIINQVLNISRVESGRVAVKYRPVELSQFAQEAIREIEMGDRQQHRFAYAQTGSPAAVSTDPSLLHHVLSNLLGNAVRYSPVGTTITVNLDLTQKEFVLTVTDEGIGVPEAEREGIFQPFIRGSNVGQIGGTGLGLNIVKRYVELMGGTIKLLSSERGARFQVRIPSFPST